jgi:VWFA-related protein
MNLRRFALPVFLLMQLATTSFAQDIATIRVVSGEVYIVVLVTERNKPITDLRMGDFEVFDNGVPQEIGSVILQKQTPITATLVFDLSISVAGRLFNELKNAANAFLEDLGKEDHIALITFNNAVVLGCLPTQDHSSAKLALERTQPSGNSSLIDASYAGLLLAQSQRDPPLLIIFSDGRDTSSWLTPQAVFETAESSEAVVYAVSTALLPDKSFLGKLAEISGGFPIELTKDLTFAFLSILREFRQSYLVTYIPRGVTDKGWHKLDVRVKRPGANVRARPGYMRGSSTE